MPGGDRTGPRGFGPMTGRRAGYCAGYDRPGFDNPHPGYGVRYSGSYGGRGGGHGWRHWYHATGVPGWARSGYEPLTQESELTRLKAERDKLRGCAEALDRRIAELEEKE
jgi:hypothetical protein